MHLRRSVPVPIHASAGAWPLSPPCCAQSMHTSAYRTALGVEKARALNILLTATYTSYITRNAIQGMLRLRPSGLPNNSLTHSALTFLLTWSLMRKALLCIPLPRVQQPETRPGTYGTVRYGTASLALALYSKGVPKWLTGCRAGGGQSPDARGSTP